MFWGDRRMNVLNVNRSTRRVLVGGRKHSCGNCEVRWVDERRLGTRPRKMAARVIRSILDVPAEVAEAISWTPTRICKPTASPPGSWEKIQAMRLRVERGETLWHAEDADRTGWVGESFVGEGAGLNFERVSN